jgi:hypothetical protein
MITVFCVVQYLCPRVPGGHRIPLRKDEDETEQERRKRRGKVRKVMEKTFHMKYEM